jgi:hypothetical protein
MAARAEVARLARKSEKQVVAAPAAADAREATVQGAPRFNVRHKTAMMSMETHAGDCAAGRDLSQGARGSGFGHGEA